MRRLENDVSGTELAKVHDVGRARIGNIKKRCIYAKSPIYLAVLHVVQ